MAKDKDDSGDGFQSKFSGDQADGDAILNADAPEIDAARQAEFDRLYGGPAGGGPGGEDRAAGRPTAPHPPDAEDRR